MCGRLISPEIPTGCGWVGTVRYRIDAALGIEIKQPLASEGEHDTVGRGHTERNKGECGLEPKLPGARPGTSSDLAPGRGAVYLTPLRARGDAFPWEREAAS